MAGFDPVTLSLAKKYSDSKGGYVEKSVITYDGNGEKIDLLGDGSTFAKISDNPADLSTAKQVKVFSRTNEKYGIFDAVYTTEAGIGFLAYGDVIFAISAPQNNEAGFASGLYVFDGDFSGMGVGYCASIETETIHPIDPKYLPKGGVGVSEKNLLTLGSYDGDSKPSLAPDMSEGFRPVKVSDFAIDLESLTKVFVYNDGKTKQTIHSSVCRIEKGGSYAKLMFNYYGNDINLVTVTYAGDFAGEGTWFAEEAIEAESRTMWVDSIEYETIHPIEPKFLPGGFEKTMLYDGSPTKMDLTAAGFGYAYLLSGEDLLSAAMGQNVHYEYTKADGTTAKGVLENYDYMAELSTPIAYGAFTLLYAPALGGCGVSFNYADVGEITNLKLWTEYSENKPYYLQAVNSETISDAKTLPFDYEKALTAANKGLLLVCVDGYIPQNPLCVVRTLFGNEGIKGFHVCVLEPAGGGSFGTVDIPFRQDGDTSVVILRNTLAYE